MRITRSVVAYQMLITLPERYHLILINIGTCHFWPEDKSHIVIKIVRVVNPAPINKDGEYGILFFRVLSFKSGIDVDVKMHYKLFRSLTIPLKYLLIKILTP